MTLQTFSVLLYTSRLYRDMTFGVDDTCEAVCRELCKDLDIKPISNLLFSLRIKGTTNFLPGCRPVQAGERYEFRLRHQVPKLTEFKKIDKIAYNYYFHQVKYDLINDAIPELKYPHHKEKVFGLAVTSMYIEMLERGITVEELDKHYENHLPKKHITKHRLFLRQIILKELRDIKNMDHDSYYVKSTYLESINTLVPHYLMEKYSGIVPYLPEDNFLDGTCTVDIEFLPFHSERPGLSVYYPYKKAWKHVAKIDDIFAIIVDRQVVKLEIRDCPAGFSILINDQANRESFVSCLATYYRLMVKWTVDLCRELYSPTLQTLRDLKCHGPIGGEYAYTKLQNRQCASGSYIIRQCEKIYENYYIDIVVKPNHIETFKITQKYDMWHLHSHEGTIKAFNNLTELAKSIKTQSKQKFRLAPSEYDKSTSLLLCQPPYQVTAKQSINEHSENELRKKRAQLFDPIKDFRKYQNSQKIIENGIITQIRAEWILPEDKKLDVTLKILNSEKHLTEFLRLAEKWSNLFSPELIKMYGFTLTSPYTLVMESTRLGSLDEFLQRQHPPVSAKNLIEASLTLARALHYLQENNIIHGRIRCASLHVARHDEDNLVVRLGDPGFRKSYTNDDLPWIPFEYHQNMEQAKMDFTAEIWAYATTLWEIFSHGRTPTLREFYASKRRLGRPRDCPEDMYDIMKEGWHESPDKRFSPQAVFSKLIIARERQNVHRYQTLHPFIRDDNHSTIGSIHSTRTEETHIGMSNGTDSPDRISNLSSGSSIETISESSTNGYTNEITPLISDSQSDRTIMSECPTLHDYSQSIIELDDGGKLIYQGKIGDGHYGSVYRGQYENELNNECVTQVAIKRLKAIPETNVLRDFEREIKIMQNLKHPNIVKIITWIDNPQILIVMEYVRHRSFLLYLSSQSPLLTTQRLLKFAKDIASGMEYLVSKKIVHRDLAARNILVDSEECVKISDFGLAQVADSNGYYIAQSERAIPIKWYAPEVLKSNKYSYSSDVWSYGVTLFEMFSRGQEPNLVPGKDLQAEELLARLENGQRLARPNLCPEHIYDSLLLSCWRSNPKERPNFTQLLQIIHDRIAENGEDI